MIDWLMIRPASKNKRFSLKQELNLKLWVNAGFKTHHAFHFPASGIMGNQSFSSSTAHCARNSLFPLWLLLLKSIFTQRTTKSEDKKTKTKQERISIKNLIIRIVDKLFAITCASSPITKWNSGHKRNSQWHKMHFIVRHYSNSANRCIIYATAEIITEMCRINKWNSTEN